MAVTFTEPIRVISSIDTSYTTASGAVTISTVTGLGSSGTTGEVAALNAPLAVIQYDLNGSYLTTSFTPAGSLSASASATPLYSGIHAIAVISSVTASVVQGAYGSLTANISFGPFDLGGFAGLTADMVLLSTDIQGATGFLHNATAAIKPIGALQAFCTVSNIFDFAGAIKFTADAGSVAGEVGTLSGAIGIGLEISYLPGTIGTFDKPIVLGLLTSAALFEDVVASTTLSFGNLLGLSTTASAPSAAFVTAWTINLANRAHSTYSQFAPNSACSFNGKSLAAFADGIYELVGDKDGAADVNARLRTGLLDFGSTNIKYIPDLYLHGRDYNGDLEVTVTADETTEVSYEVPYDGRTGIRNRRMKLAKGVRGRSWQFEVRNVGGCMMELESLEAPVAVSQRRI